MKITIASSKTIAVSGKSLFIACFTLTIFLIASVIYYQPIKRWLQEKYFPEDKIAKHALDAPRPTSTIGKNPVTINVKKNIGGQITANSQGINIVNK